MSDHNKKDEPPSGGAPPNELSPEVRMVLERMRQMNTSEEEEDTHHAFWDTQPMQRQEDLPEGPIHQPSPEEIRTTEYGMPAGFEWSNVNVTDDAERLELYDLLANNYVEDGVRIATLTAEKD